MRLIAVLLLVTLTLAGCFGGPSKLSQEEAEEVARSSMESFAVDFASADGGDLTKMSGTFQAEEDPDAEFGFGDATVTFTVEWGLDDTSMAQMSMDSGGFSFEVSIYCSATRTVLVFGSDSVESRPGEGSCLDAYGEGGDPLEVDEFDDMPLLEATPTDDGGVIASFDDDNGTVTVHIDSKERVTKLEIDTEQGSGTMDISYGARRTIPLPEADERMPLLVYGFGYFDGDSFEWSGGGDQNTAPFDEIEIRVMDGETIVATFTPAPGAQESGDFTMEFTDDGDGVFGAEDTFSISSPSWTSSSDYEVVVWDTWADREVGDAPVPGFGVLALLGAIGAALVVARR